MAESSSHSNVTCQSSPEFGLKKKSKTRDELGEATEFEWKKEEEEE